MVQRKTNQCLSKAIDFNPHIDLRYMSIEEYNEIVLRGLGILD